MATKKYLNYDGVAYLWEKIKNALLGKVDKVDGKGLSSNDYTATEKAKLANIEAGAEVNVNADWNATTGDAAILNKPSIPSKTSDLTNDSNYVSDASYVHTDNNYTNAEKTKLTNIAAGAQVNVLEGITVNGTAATITNKVAAITVPTVDSTMSDSSNNPVRNSTVKAYIDSAIGGVTGIDFQVVTTLPATGTKGVIYLVSNSGSGNNAYDEYIWVTNRFEKIGTTDVDLSGYQLSAELVAITNSEIDTIVAG